MIIPLILLLSATFAAPAPLSADTETELSQNPETVAAYVRKYYADTPILAEIGWCESRYRQWNPDGTVFIGKVNRHDIGVMQVNNLYHGEKATDLGFDIYSLSGNLAYAKYLYEKEGSKPWASSKACWGEKKGEQYKDVAAK